MDMHSGIVISKADGRPMYLQIMEQIRQRVAVGDWRPGQDIPSIRQLAMDLQVSVITVKRAYLELERDGVIVTQQGRGSSVAPDAVSSRQLYTEDLAQRLEQAVRLGAAIGLSPDELATRLRDVADRLKGDAS
jgi:GntR family transcriptional regulator